MNTFLQDVENILKRYGESGLIQLEHYSGIILELHREDNTGNKFSSAYGHSSGGTTSIVTEFKGIIQGNDFIQKSDHFTGNFEEGFLFVKDVEIRTNDVIKIKSDEIIRKYKVNNEKNLGLTKTIFSMWELTNLGD